MLNIPSGTIALWKKPIPSIPPGWFLCDGTHGTPDLRDRFLVGAGLTYNRGDSGGSVNHTHPFLSVGHAHSIRAGNYVKAGVGFESYTNSAVDFGNTNPTDNLPPYYALAYIQKS